jgi:hypothetical protein
MKNAVYIDNFNSHFDFNSLITDLKSKTPNRRTPENPYGTPIETNLEIKQAKEHMGKLWSNAGYMSASSVEWLNYYPDQHFNNSIVETFSKLINADPYNVWISSMMPGKCVPWHWDVIKDYIKYKDDPRMVRYSLFFDNPMPGKVFILNDESFHMTEQGAVFKWTKWDDWHLGFNCSLEQKFMFHYIGFQKE